MTTEQIVFYVSLAAIVAIMAVLIVRTVMTVRRTLAIKRKLEEDIKNREAAPSTENPEDNDGYEPLDITEKDKKE